MSWGFLFRVNGTGGRPPVPFGVLDSAMSVLDGDYILTDMQPLGASVCLQTHTSSSHTDFVPAAAAQLAVEITPTTTAHHDRTAKAMGYAEAGVPLYLLVDGSAPGGPTVTLYGEPKDGVYRLLRAGKFGERIRLPEPFGLELDTGEFPEE
ncbi:hypothetical protein CA983_21890 [Streptomyces swartbergensis]|uniref:Putative restriction endonuclease domain-containing protein n=1 Tax=Streptomyces swartbergensis TaxID=487165 RepID=A0A243S0T8_9ACTN|nr:hypothetical protein CA983_21890 [Streptomyces swartbergensis]